MPKDIYNIVNRYKKYKDKFSNFVYFPTKSVKIKINKNNLSIAVKWLEQKEKDLYSQKGFNDEKIRIQISKTMYKWYSSYMLNTLYWFNDKNFQNLSQKDIEEVFYKLEKCELPTVKGKYQISENTRKDIYGRVFKGDFFEHIGKKKLSQNAIKRKFKERKMKARFFRFSTMKILDSNARNQKHRLAYWLLFDTGIEVMALLNLKKSNFTIEKDEEGTNQIKYYIQDDIAKEGRTERIDYIWFDETKALLSNALEQINQDEYLFDNFSQGALYGALRKIVEENNLLTEGHINKPLRPKDFRSSMACYMLDENYSLSDIKRRLGHSITSTILDAYTNWKAVDTQKPLKHHKEKEKENLAKELKKTQEKLNHMTNQYNEVKEQQEKLLELTKSWKDILNILSKEGQVGFTKGKKDYEITEIERLKDKINKL